VDDSENNFYSSLTVCTHKTEFYMTKVELELGVEILNWTSDRYTTTDLCHSHSIGTSALVTIPQRYNVYYQTLTTGSDDYFIRWISIYDED
jgi:hypothetical protein